MYTSNTLSIRCLTGFVINGTGVTTLAYKTEFQTSVNILQQIYHFAKSIIYHLTSGIIFTKIE